MGPGSLVLWNARLIDRREPAFVTIGDGRIAEIGEAGGTPPPGAVDLVGRTLLPGLIDAHTHLSSDVDRSPGFGPRPPLKGEEPRPRELGWFVLANTARELLRAGITSVRDVGSFDDEAIVLRRAVELGLVEGPRILSCGRIISATAPGGLLFGTMYREADGVGVENSVSLELRAERRPIGGVEVFQPFGFGSDASASAVVRKR